MRQRDRKHRNFDPQLKKLVNLIRKNGFWYIDIPRTSSTSIKTELASQYGSLYGKSKRIDKNSPAKQYFRDHLTAQDARSLFTREVWKELFTFTIVRNPWDRMVSLYFFRLKKGHLPPTVGFGNYIDQLKAPRYERANSLHAHPVFYYGLAEYVLDEKDNIIVDYIGKYENRAESLKTISGHIGAENIGELYLHQAKPSGVHYSKYYCNETRKLVADVFAKDIELFGYEFEDLA